MRWLETKQIRGLIGQLVDADPGETIRIGMKCITDAEACGGQELSSFCLTKSKDLCADRDAVLVVIEQLY